MMKTWHWKCYTDLYMMTRGEVETEPSHAGVYSVGAVVNPPLAPERLVLPYCQVTPAGPRPRG